VVTLKEAQKTDKEMGAWGGRGECSLFLLGQIKFNTLNYTIFRNVEIF
jgi:hypothetical protein